MTRRHGDVPPIIRESGDPEARTLDDVAREAIARSARDDRGDMEELAWLLREALYRARPGQWCGDLDDAAQAMAPLLYEWGVRVQR